MPFWTRTSKHSGSKPTTLATTLQRFGAFETNSRISTIFLNDKKKNLRLSQSGYRWNPFEFFTPSPATRLINKTTPVSCIKYTKRKKTHQSWKRKVGFPLLIPFPSQYILPWKVDIKYVFLICTVFWFSNLCAVFLYFSSFLTPTS